MASRFINKMTKWETTFKTKGGLYERFMMPFMLADAPSTFITSMD